MSTSLVQKLLGEYEEYLRALGRSPHTIQHYKDTIVLFLRFLKGKKPCDVSLEDTLQFMSWLRTRNGVVGVRYSDASVVTRMADLKSFFRWISEHKKVDCLDWRFIPTPRSRRNRIDYLTREEFINLVKHIPYNTFEGARLRASVEVLLSSGVRLAEFINMKITDINLKTGEFVVRGKGSKYGVCYLNKRALHWLARYTRERGDKSPYLWVSRHGGVVRQLDRATFWQQIKRLKVRSGISKRVHPHTFRHSTATIMLQNGANIRQVQEVLRHESIMSTQIYTHYVNKDVQRAHAKYMNI